MFGKNIKEQNLFVIYIDNTRKLKKNGEVYIRPNKSSEVYYEYIILHPQSEEVISEGKISVSYCKEQGKTEAQLIAEYHGLTDCYCYNWQTDLWCFKKDKDKFLEGKWKEFKTLNLDDYNYNKNNPDEGDYDLRLSADWFLFKKGTKVERINRWFDDNHGKGIMWLDEVKE